jgi:Tol biopolymer transport system component
LTFDPTFDTVPLWTPDSRRIAFLSFNSAGGKSQICWKAADGTGKVEPLGSFPTGEPLPSSWADNGKTLISTVLPISNAASLVSSPSIPFVFDVNQNFLRVDSLKIKLFR